VPSEAILLIIPFAENYEPRENCNSKFFECQNSQQLRFCSPTAFVIREDYSTRTWKLV
jgi:hypothetical protein